MQTLEMTFPTSNSCLRDCSKIFCSWGQKKTPYDVNGQMKGQTAPLWANLSRKWFLILFILNLISSLLYIGSIITVKFSGCYDSNSTFLALDIAFNIVLSIVLFANSFYWLFLYFQTYANDQEWSRYLTFLVAFDLALLGLITANFVLVVKYLAKNDQLCANEVISRAFFGMNLAASIFTIIISLIMLVKSIMLAREMFLPKYVPHTAICEDEDIIIME